MKRPLVYIFAGCWLGEALFHANHGMVFLALLFAWIWMILIRKKYVNQSAIFLVFIFMYLLGCVAAWGYTISVKQIEKQGTQLKGHTIEATITWIDYGTTYDYFVVNQIQDETGKKYEGKAYVYVEETKNYQIGNRVKLQGDLSLFEEPTNLGEFSLKEYYQNLGVHYSMFANHISLKTAKVNVLKQILYKMRNTLNHKLEHMYQGDVLAVVKSMLIGDKTDLSQDVKNDFNGCGILHILAISGLHISFVGQGLFLFLKRIGAPIWMRFGLSGSVVSIYCLLTGFRVSAKRALFMFLIYLIAQGLGKSYDLLSSLSLSGTLLLLWNPSYATNQSFVMSVGAILIIGIFLSCLKKEKGKKSSVKQNLIFCLFLQFGMLPLQIYFQYEFIAFSFVSNFLILPIVQIAYGMALFSIFIPILSYLAMGLYQLILCISGTMNAYWIPKITIGKVSILFVILYYLFFVLLLMKKKKKYFVTIGLLCFLSLQPQPDRIAFLDVGQGDCEVICKNGTCVMIDGGSTSKKNVGQYVIKPYLKYQGVGKVDLAIITHTDADHYSGILELLENDDIKALLLPKIKKDTMYLEIEKMAKKHKVQILYGCAGRTIQVGEIQLQCYHPKIDSSLEKNAASFVMRLKMWDESFLFTGDIEKEGEDELHQQNLPKSTVLKVAHHGSKYATSQLFLQQIQPRIAIISSGKQNRYGHPHKELLQRLESYHTQIYQTQKQGMIWFESQNRSLRLFHFANSS